MATVRAETVRLAKRILHLDDELTDNRDQVEQFRCLPGDEFSDLPGVGRSPLR